MREKNHTTSGEDKSRDGSQKDSIVKKGNWRCILKIEFEIAKKLIQKFKKTEYQLNLGYQR